jgi:uncharacterized protein (DUF433 family)
MFDRITFDPNITGGRACIRGMRIPVFVIVSHFADCLSFDEVLMSFRRLNERTSIKLSPTRRP